MAHPTKPTSHLGDPVLDAAATLFSQQGWHKLSLEGVAAAAKTPLKDVLQRYPTRDHLAAGIFEQVLHLLPDELSAEVLAKVPLEDRLVAIVAHQLSMLEPYKPFVRQAFARIVNPLTLSAFLQAKSAARFIGYVSEQIDVARDRRQIGFWVIPSVAAAAFWALDLRILVHWFGDTGRGSESTYAVAHRWIRAFARTLGARSAAPSPERRADRDDIVVEQLFFEEAVNRRASRSFTVVNDHDTKITTRIHATSFKADTSGHTIAPKVTFDPAVVKIEPGESETVQAWMMMPRDAALAVDYHGRFVVEALPDNHIEVTVRRTDRSIEPDVEDGVEEPAPERPKRRAKVKKQPTP